MSTRVHTRPLRSVPTPAGVTLETVEVERLVRHPLQPRKDLGDLTELTASIKEFGILQPVVALPDPTGTDRLFILYGHRRRQAAILAGLAEVPVNVVRHDNLATDAQQLITMLAENLFREDISPVEEGDAYEQLRLLDDSYTPARIAAALGRRKATVDRRLALRKLPAPVREKLHTGQIAISDADVLVEFAGEHDVLGRLVEQIGTPEWRYTVEAERRRREAVNAVRKKVTAAERAGVPVLRPQTREWQYAPPADGQPTPLTRLDVDDHDEHERSCPGRVLIVYPAGDQAVRGCVEPSLHGLFTDGTRGSAGSAGSAAAPPSADAGQMPGEQDARAAADAIDEELRLREELEAAADARDAWIREELLAPGVRPNRIACTVMLRQVLHYLLDASGGGEEFAGGRAGDLLGYPLDPGEDHAAAVAAWGERLVMHLESAPLERLVQVAWALLVSTEVGRLTTPHLWTEKYAAPYAARHLAGLQALGYIPCDVEVRMLAGQAEGGG